MTRDAMPEKRQPSLEPLDEAIDHVRGPTAGRLIVEYARNSAHWIARSAEPDEDWSWCYLDIVAFVVTRR